MKIIRFKLIEGQMVVIYCGQIQGTIDPDKVRETRKHYEGFYETHK